MKKLYLVRLLAVFLVAGGIWSCANVDELSDDNSITGFKVVSHTPSNILIDEAELVEGAIKIPVMYGMDKFPLTVNVEVKYSSGIDKVEGVDFSKGVVLESMDTQIEFFVMAKSGLPRKYVISCYEKEYELQDYLDIRVGSVSPEGTPVLGKVRVNDDNTMDFFMVNPQFPISFVPAFSHTEVLDFEGFDNGTTAFAFETENDFITISIINKVNGAKRDFRTYVKSLDLVSGTDGEEHETTDIYNSNFSASIGDAFDYEYKGFRIDGGRDSISVYMTRKDAAAAFPVDLDVVFSQFPTSSGLMGISGTDKITFEGFGEPSTFYVGDASDGTARLWSIVPVEHRILGEADILSFTYTYTANQSMFISWGPPMKTGKSIVLDADNVDIFPQSREIWLRATEINDPGLLDSSWWLRLANTVLTVSEGASIDQDRLPDPYYQGKGAWHNIRYYYVIPAGGTAEDAVEWQLKIRDYREHTPSSEAVIESGSVTSLMPLMARLDPADPVSVNRADNTVSIRLADDEGCYPLTVKLDYVLSEFAQVTSQNNNTEAMVFDTVESTNTVTVTAENGTEAEWTVKLIPPVKSAGTNVASFRVTSFSSSVYSLLGINIDTDQSEIVITLDRAGSCPVTVGYAMSLSRNATADVDLEGSFKFNNLNEIHRFNVISSFGETRSWTLRFAAHTPQLTNWNMDSWQNELTPLPAGRKGQPYWATANNTVVDVTDRGTGVTGYAARLTTKWVSLIRRTASGSIFLGWFDGSNALAGYGDPVILTFQGIEWAATKKIVALEVDIQYSGAGTDTGSAAIELIKQSPYDESKYVFHGNRGDGTPHPDNAKANAYSYIRRHAIIGNTAATGVTEVVARGEWKTIRINIDYGDLDPFDYTHLSIMFASSSDGDNFNGVEGSQMLVDNIKLIYED